jgi:NADH-quinone oxidoreductase subunit A
MICAKVYTPIDYLPIMIQSFVVLGFVVTTMIATHMLGPKRNTKQKLENFECGIEGMGNARSPFSVKYFVIAILFVLFDVEVIFLYPWAVNFKELGIQGFVGVVSFSALLLSGFGYLMLKGAFDWEK